MLLITLLMRRRYICIKIKIFMYVFRILKDYYLVGFGNVIMNITYILIEDTNVLHSKCFYQIKTWLLLKADAACLACDVISIDIYAVRLRKFPQLLHCNRSWFLTKGSFFWSYERNCLLAREYQSLILVMTWHF